MKRVHMLLQSCILAVFLMGMVFGQTYNFGPSNGKVGFEVGSIHGKIKVDFKEFEAKVKFDPRDLSGSSIEGKIVSNSIDSGNGSRDGSLKGSKYLSSSKFPAMTFSSKRIVKDGSGYKAIGTMSIKGKSREFEMPFTFVNGQFKSSFTLKFTDYGVSGGGFFHEDDGKVEMSFGG